MAAQVLVVNTDEETLYRIKLVLIRAGCDVIGASTYEEARSILDADPPKLLIADVRLGAFNGFHLALRSGLQSPATRIIITDRVQGDAITERTAVEGGVVLIGDPLNNPQFVASVRRALGIAGGGFSVIRRWARKQLSRPVTIDVAEEQVSIVDISYGGCRLALSHPANVPTDFEVILPDSGASVRLRRVWALGDEKSTLAFGAAVVHPQANPWRGFVDSVT